MPVKINGSSSGSVTLAAPASGSDVTLTLPTTALATTANVDTAVAPMGLVAVAPTSIANSGGSASLSNYTVSFSGVSSVSLNGVFSGDYDNYRVLVDVTSWPSLAANQYLRLRLRVGGSDNSGAAYSYGGRSVNGAVQASDIGEDNVTTGFAVGRIEVTGGSSSEFTASDCMLYGPFTSNKTKLTGLISGAYLTRHMGIYVGGGHNVTSAFDGFTLYAPAQTMTGTVSVYGFQK